MTEHPAHIESDIDIRRQATALRRLTQLAAQQPELAAVLADVDASVLEQRLTPAGLADEAASAEREDAFETAWSERHRRIHEAGGGSYCTCGHTYLRHHGPLTEDLRLPCDDLGCDCMDLDVQAPVGA
ncbi:hypothetical protein AB0J38_14515 [Streptomyces sp. NPDC050095]|uniref:hypothetical protein n=1 Tax=unclassified Streptomyces TaxID=2593676 RepID=UPI00343FBFFC